MRILVVDDEQMVRENLVDYLEDEGLDVISVGSAEEALKLMKTEKADIAIVDMRLPVMHGNDLIIHLKAQHPDMDFIIHTGSVDYAVPPDVKAYGISSDNVLLKPVADMDLFIQKIRTLFGNKYDI
ncbi:response regulator [Maridesulfovibrio hydrothermalis]|uniref:Response regulator receiver protein n=1 Tax=Maridesulfovibrio hydrothermalis AM13 = DSM 14728 TaxID=1121451 RepID=L0RF85_9BACT|nr:response regulator [Maridesulfovibrio hydrothermalis]CCO25428.1 Response regulator receiver protein [Maridesulfovibrio hydrothermalis AM13 = DSM 14728]